MDSMGLENLNIVADGDPGIPFYATAKTNSENAFDNIIGTIEDIIVEEEFQVMLNNFMESHWSEFTDDPENKLEYTLIFNEYVDKIEKYIENQLNLKYPGFDMDEFVIQLERKIQQEHWEGEVFEVLATFSDFMAFREMFRDYKAFKEGNAADLSTAICVTSLPYEESIVMDEGV